MAVRFTALIGLPLCLAVAQPAWAAPPRSAVPAALQADTPQGPEVVLAGMYLVNIADIDLRTSSFFADFYFWFLWSGDHDPTVTYEFTNGITKEITTAANFFAPDDHTPQADVLPDGRRYQAYHVQGRFIQPYHVHNYPFDGQTLVISLEDLTWDAGTLVYDADYAGSRSRPGFAISGWNPGPLRVAKSLNHYPSDFGDPRVNGQGYTFSHLDFVVAIRRPGLSLVFQKFFPIMLVVVVCLGAFLLDPHYIEARLTLAAPALIAAVALQLTTEGELPPRGHIFLVDEVYLLSYVVILMIIVECLVVHRMATANKGPEARRLDVVSLGLLSAIFLGGTAALIGFR